MSPGSAAAAFLFRVLAGVAGAAAAALEPLVLLGLEAEEEEGSEDDPPPLATDSAEEDEPFLPSSAYFLFCFLTLPLLLLGGS